VLQWVTSTSDGSNLQLTNPVVLVLGPLLAPPQDGTHVGTMLEEVSLTFQIPVKPLGKLCPSECIYPLISLLFQESRAFNSNQLFQAWDMNWTSIYQLDHGLRACGSIAVANDPVSLTTPQLHKHPLWTPLVGPTLMLLPPAKAARVSLANKDNPTAQGAWTVSKLLLLPEGSNLPVGFGIVVDATFSRKLFTQQLASQHGSGLATYVEAWLHSAWCDSWFMGIS